MTNEDKTKKMAAYYCVFIRFYYIYTAYVIALPCFQCDVRYKKNCGAVFLILTVEGQNVEQ